MTEVVPESASLARLRNAWLESSHVPAGEACLSADWIWEAVTGAQTPEALASGLDHVTQCAACAEAWRVAHELLVATGQAGGERREGAAWKSWRVWLPAAAALIVLAGGVASDRGWFERRPTRSDSDVVRGGAAVLASTLTGTSCDRSACRLEWSDAGPGARYTVRVTSATLEPLSFATGLGAPAYTVPVSAVAALPPASEVLWQVEAVLPDGRRVASTTFVLTVR